ncbi:Protein CBR-RHR-1 [Aphelenchoides fujianensis]|nr:Protein CBR-RHR-1 [Aphelenchoides fujianensis]
MATGKFQTHGFTIIVALFTVVRSPPHDFANVSRNAPLLHDTHAFVLIGFGFLHGYFTISLRDFAKADYTAAAVLISFGALVGKLSPIQYVFLAILETPVQAGDLGGSIVVHLFGAVFGLAASRLLFKPSWAVSEHLGSIYHSDIFSFVGTVFPVGLLPSFNSIFAITAAEQQRSLVTKDHRFNIKHIASASLAGGVAAGTVSTLILAPFPALLVGVIAGAASVLSFEHLTPALGKKFNFHDTRGVFSLHGIPAIVGVLASVVLLFIVPLGALFLTIFIALISGAITGVILKLSLWTQVREKEVFADADFFPNVERKQLLANDAAVIPTTVTTTA